jgi:hypothetical protein
MKEMKSAIALLVSLGLFIAAAPLHAESDATKSDTTSTQGSSGKEDSNSKSTDTKKKDKGSDGQGASSAEPECN